MNTVGYRCDISAPPRLSIGGPPTLGCWLKMAPSSNDFDTPGLDVLPIIFRVLVENFPTNWIELN